MKKEIDSSISWIDTEEKEMKPLACDVWVFVSLTWIASNLEKAWSTVTSIEAHNHNQNSPKEFNNRLALEIPQLYFDVQM